MTPLSSPCLTHPPLARTQTKTNAGGSQALPTNQLARNPPGTNPCIAVWPHPFFSLHLCLLWGRGRCFDLRALHRVGGVVLCARVAKLTSRQVMPRTKKELVFKSRLQKSRQVHTFFFCLQSHVTSRQELATCAQQHHHNRRAHSHARIAQQRRRARTFSATALWSLSPFFCVTHAFWGSHTCVFRVWGSVVFIPPLCTFRAGFSPPFSVLLLSEA